MKHGKRAFRRVGLVLLVMFTLGLVVVGPQVVPTYATDDLLFANTKDPVGVAAGFDPGGTKPRIYVTPCRNPRRIVFIEADGSVRRFHSLPNRSGDCARDDIEVAPGGKLEAFGDNNVYVTQGNKIYKITPDGRTRTDFATLTEAGVTCTDASSDITFDDISTPGDPNGFNNDMVATCGSRVWRINAGGAVTLVATFLFAVQGPAVAPKSFAPAPGQVLVAAPGSDEVWAVEPVPGGSPELIATWPGAKGVHVVPPNVCSIGTVSQTDAERGTFFIARTARDQIRKLPKTVFTTYEGRILVTNNGQFSNATKIGIVPPSGTLPLVTADFHIFNFAQDQGSAEFCPRLRVKIFIKPGSFRKYEPESNGKIPVVIFGTDAVDVTKIDPTTLRFGDTGNEASWSHCDNSSQDINGDGFLDLKCHFTFALTELDPGDTQAILTGIVNPPFEGRD